MVGGVRRAITETMNIVKSDTDGGRNPRCHYKMSYDKCEDHIISRHSTSHHITTGNPLVSPSAGLAG